LVRKLRKDQKIFFDFSTRHLKNIAMFLNAWIPYNIAVKNVLDAIAVPDHAKKVAEIIWEL
jgi:hypothetical protein